MYRTYIILLAQKEGEEKEEKEKEEKHKRRKKRKKRRHARRKTTAWILNRKPYYKSNNAFLHVVLTSTGFVRRKILIS